MNVQHKKNITKGVNNMSEEHNGSWSVKPFILLDGGDDNNVRAEVRVTKGFGLVHSITPNENGRVASIGMTIQHPNMKRPIYGHMNMDEDAFKILQEAKDSGRLVHFRIESQRKAKVDRTIPMSELTSTMEIAGQNTTRIFVGAGFTEPITLTSEALTDPEDDPKREGGVQSAIAARQAKPSAPAPAQNNAPASSNRAFSREEAAYKTYNSDGRFNVGSAAFAAAVSAEQFSREMFMLADISDEERDTNTAIMARGILRIADAVQGSVYDEGYRSDRSSASHTRARGIIYDTIRKYVPLDQAEITVGSDEFNQWMIDVQNFASKRMRLAFTLATEEDETITETGDAVVDNNMPESAPAYPDFIHIVSATPQKDGPRTSDETLENLKALVADAGIAQENMGALGALMELTTGIRVVANNSDDVVGDFIDAYMNEGDLNNAVQWVAQNQAK